MLRFARGHVAPVCLLAKLPKIHREYRRYLSRASHVSIHVSMNILPTYARYPAKMYTHTGHTRNDYRSFPRRWPPPGQELMQNQRRFVLLHSFATIFRDRLVIWRVICSESVSDERRDSQIYFVKTMNSYDAPTQALFKKLSLNTRYSAILWRPVIFQKDTIFDFVS